MGLSPTTAYLSQDYLERQYLEQDNKKTLKGYHVVPHDDDSRCDLNEPLQRGGDAIGPIRRKSRQSTLASSRVQRDQLLRKLEDLIMKEAELASAYELFDYTRKRCSLEHEQIVVKLTNYETLLQEVQQREAEMRREGVDEILPSEHERERWRLTQEMVQYTLPELLSRLEDSIDVNSEKIRNIQEKMEEIRTRRLAVREEIALKEEDIALALQ
uniref:Uncharacterized protein n=1 Tax=Globisporangium ultimum (strain ATCC 200006 / CBS 805.95 / DAOM BR144) TaxID=431595 RepID=K3WS77_GLOUD